MPKGAGCRDADPAFNSDAVRSMRTSDTVGGGQGPREESATKNNTYIYINMDIRI